MASRFSPVRSHPARGVRRRLRTRARRRQVESPPQHSPGAGSPTPRVVRRSLRYRVRTPPAETRQTFRVRRQARVEPSHDDGSHLPPPGGHGAHRGNLRQLRHGIRRYARGHGARSRSAPAARPSAEERARPRSPSRQLFVRLRAPPWRSIGSSPPLHAQAPSESASKRLSSEDVIKYTKEFIVQFREVRRTRRRLRPAGAGSLPRVIAPIRALVAPSTGRQSVFFVVVFLFFFVNVARDVRATPPPPFGAPFVFLSRRERRRLTRRPPRTRFVLHSYSTQRCAEMPVELATSPLEVVINDVNDDPSRRTTRRRRSGARRKPRRAPPPPRTRRATARATRRTGRISPRIRPRGPRRTPRNPARSPGGSDPAGASI